MRRPLQPVDSRYLIDGAILVLCLLILVLAGHTGWTAWSHHRQVRNMEAMKTAVDQIIRADVLLARERGLTSMALGADAATRSRLRPEILKLRQQGDAAWNRALHLAAGLTNGAPADAALPSAIAATRRAHTLLNDARARRDWALDHPATRQDMHAWFGTATRHIEATTRLRHALFATTVVPAEASRLHHFLHGWAWQAGEHLGWERGTLAYYIAADEPVPAAIARELRVNWRLALRALDALQELQGDEAVGSSIRSALQAVRPRLDESLTPLREEVYRASETGAFPVDAQRWWDGYTATIDAVLAVSDTVSAAAEQKARALSQRAAWLLVGSGGVGLLALGLVGFSLTRVRQTAATLFHHKELAEVTLHSIGDAVITTDQDARVDYLNPIAEELTGWSARDAYGLPVTEVFHIVDTRSREAHSNPVAETLRTGHVIHVPDDTILVRKDGQEIPIDDSAAPIRDREDHIVGAVLVFYDISEGAPHAQHLLSYHATHDSLTQLVNRREFERRLNKLLARARSDGGEHALCYLDLAQFTLINDTCGHIAGDRLLRQLGYLLNQRVPEKDTLARLGGDEFGLLLEDCPRECAHEILEDLLQVIRDFRFVWEERSFELGASIGLAPITAQTTTAQEALSQADTACFVAKEGGRHRIEVYTPGDSEVARQHSQMHWVSRINAALENDRLELDCQPIVALAAADAAERGEVLVRMRDEDGNRVSPGEFIPPAERYDLMHHIDFWVINAALARIRRYLDSAEEGPVRRCTINLSGTTLGRDGLQEYVLAQVEKYAVPPRLICFEITETAAIANFDKAARLIHALRRPGFRFALDDFGSGLSSFGYLKNLPVDYLKIDGSLVRNIADDPVSYSMVSAIHGVGRAMGIQTVAEFTATDAVVEKLREIGVDYAQGFALAKPAPVEAFFPAKD